MVHIPSCPLCSGRRPFCIHKSYPFPTVNVEKIVQAKLRKDFFGPSYSVFVGKHDYPQVMAGPMVGLDERKGIDSPENWFGMKYSDIVELRSFILRSKKSENIFSRERFVREMQELALAKKSADVEVVFRRTPVFSFSLSETFQPMGPSGTLEKMRVADNVSVRQKVERIVTDELNAGEQVSLLHDNGMNVYTLASVFSSGVLGMERTKKLVPSRWSVTCVDDIIAKKCMEHIRDYPSLNNYRVFEASYLDNHFVILLMPGSWEFENFEVWAPGSNWAVATQSQIIEEYEPFHGRNSYAEKQAGGYYAARISVVRYLERMKRQARVVSFREVGEGYSVPLGVWVVRETSQKAFEGTPKTFAVRRDAFEYCNSRLRVPVLEYMKKSAVLKQRKLVDF